MLNPGFGTIEEMSTPEIIDTINASQADLLAVFFGAEKAQAWLMHNHHRLRAPIRAQFGATINFEAGTVKRAPHFIRSTGSNGYGASRRSPICGAAIGMMERCC